jgi:hypothetical protein
VISTVLPIFRQLAKFIIPSSVHGIHVLASLAMWWTAMIVEGLLLFRAVWTKLVSRYVFFYIYMAAVWFSDGVLYIVYRIAPGSYVKWNWPANYLDAVLAFGVILEILEHAVPGDPGAGALGKIGSVGRQVVWGTALCLAIACGLVVTGAWRVRLANIQIERGLIAIQAVLLLIALGVIFYHAIPVGRNLTGMVLGYGLCVGASVMILTFRIYVGPSFNPTWQLAQPFSFWLSLMIWLLTLWNDDGEPVFGWAVMRNETAPFSLAGRARTWMRSILSIPAQGARP